MKSFLLSERDSFVSLSKQAIGMSKFNIYWTYPVRLRTHKILHHILFDMALVGGSLEFLHLHLDLNKTFVRIFVKRKTSQYVILAKQANDQQYSCYLLHLLSGLVLLLVHAGQEVILPLQLPTNNENFLKTS